MLIWLYCIFISKVTIHFNDVKNSTSAYFVLLKFQRYNLSSINKKESVGKTGSIIRSSGVQAIWQYLCFRFSVYITVPRACD